MSNREKGERMGKTILSFFLLRKRKKMNDKTEFLYIFFAIIIMLMIFVAAMGLGGDTAQILREVRELKEMLP